MDRIQEIEAYVQRTMATFKCPDLRIAHGFQHVDRVRGWALHIAREEGYPDLELVEAAALLHDVGLAAVTKRRDHGRVGAEIAARFLRERELFVEEDIVAIAEANPRALYRRDSSTKLFPFLLAATRANESDEHLSVVYELLLKTPEIFLHALEPRVDEEAE